MKISSVKTNSDAATKGRWVGDLPELGDIRVFVRGVSNPDYRRLQQKMIRALPPSKRRNGVVDPLEMDRITGVCLHLHCLLDWENVESDDGGPLPYSTEHAEEFLCKNGDYRKFRDGVFIAASQVEDEDEEDNTATEKNFERPSVTA